MEQLINEILNKIKNKELDKRVKEYDIHPKYAILNNEVFVTVRLKEGLEVKIDVTDLININSNK